MIAGSSAALTVRRMLESTRSAGPEQRRQLARVTVEELASGRPPPLRSALRAATRFASGSFSIPTARAAPSRTAAMARMPLPLPRSSTRSPGRRRALEERERGAGRAVLAAAERVLRIEDARSTGPIGVRGGPGRRDREPAELARAQPVAPAGGPVDLVQPAAFGGIGRRQRRGARRRSPR